MNPITVTRDPKRFDDSPADFPIYGQAESNEVQAIDLVQNIFEAQSISVFSKIIPKTFWSKLRHDSDFL